MSTKNVPLPGSPALAPTYQPVATASGAQDITNYTDPSGLQVTPNRTFNYIMPGGGTRTFYHGMKTSVSLAVKNALIALGWAS